MGDKTGISWTDATWNPVRGCSRVSEGCRNCYAERVAARFSGPGQPYEGLAKLKRRVNVGLVTDARWTGEVRMVEHLADPLKWKKPRRIFVNSMSDLFHEKLTNEQIAAVFGVMAAAPQHTFQILTKRAKRMREWFEWMHGDPLVHMNHGVGQYMAVPRAVAYREPHDQAQRWPLPNVWLGVSVENQEAADERIPELLRTPAAVRFLSCEPLIGPVSLALPQTWLVGATAKKILRDHGAKGPIPKMLVPPPSLDWIIAGCESGPGARPCSVEWLRSLRDQCAAAGVAFFLKQAKPIDGMATITDIRPIPQALGRIGEVIPVLGIGSNSKKKGRGVIELPYLDGMQHAAFPEVARG